MLSKLSLVAAILPVALGLQVFAPERPTSSGPVTLKWASAAGDPDTWSFYIFNEAFHDNFGIANNVDPAPQELTITLPAVPARDGYTLQAVNLGNISDVYAISPSFSIGEVASSSSNASSTSSGSATGSSTSRVSTTALSTTRASTSGTGTGTGTGAAPSDTAPTSFNNGSPAAATLPLGMTKGGVVAFAASVLAGAAMIAF